MRGKRASSRDVAREAGVSQATVSYVLNNVEGIRIRPETREAVLAAAKKLHYQPNMMAKSMKLNKVYSIGIVSDKTMSSFVFMGVLEGISDLLSKKNYSITICSNRFDDLAYVECMEYYNSNRIDGIIFVYTSLTGEQIDFLNERNIPFSILHSSADSDENLPRVVKSSLSGAVYDAMAYLKSVSPCSIGYIGANAGNMEHSRFSGYVEALKRLDIPLKEDFYYKVNASEDEMDAALDKLLPDSSNLPPSILCENINLGFYLLRYAARNNCAVPSQLRIIAIGTTQYSTRSSPSLSAIEAPLYDLGCKAAKMLLHSIDSAEIPDQVVLEWKFIKRESS